MALGKGTRSLIATVAVAAAILGSGHLLGRMSSSKAQKPQAGRSPAAVSPSPSDPAAGMAGDGLTTPAPVRSAGAAQVLLADMNVVTGPGHPPLPAERGGPFGSRRSTGTPEVALTFDDGPDPDWTPRVLELLRRYHVKATFCVVGVMVDQFPELVRDIVAEGHTLCNHTYYHNIGLSLLPASAIRADLTRTSAAIHRAAPGAKISYYRQPGGNWSPTVVAVAKQLGMSSLHWRVDPQDWSKPGANYINNYISAMTTPGAIVLMHDGGGDRHGTVEALRSLLPNLTRRFMLSALPPGVDPPRRFGIDWPIHAGQP
jgi:peptidoglycan/xylan/chitin deacetylase (PgdA/CDA1 family)